MYSFFTYSKDFILHTNLKLINAWLMYRKPELAESERMSVCLEQTQKAKKNVAYG